ncbi:MAG: Fe-S protein assembly chaperone HscA [Rhodospirillaceae bacterium]|jgi:molecular chaperone HscA|nr:Fe-S protein assembly chaperone HscA [Rhodospirillaceae bacterium]
MLLQINEPTSRSNKNDVAIGIDLGTTNSVVAVVKNGQSLVLRDEQGSGLIPSVVAYGDDGSIVVGNEARHELLSNPQIVVSSIKRLMGRGISDIKSLVGTLPFELGIAADGGMVRLKVSGKTLTPVEVSADILLAIKARAENALGSVKSAVITVPAYFDDAARNATKDAAKLAGIKVLRLINEPTAAALAYGLDNHVEGLYAIYDFGGGTFDISLLHMERGVFQVRATGGDVALGGDDLDHSIAEVFLSERTKLFGNETITSTEAKQVLSIGRMAKECLSINSCGDWVIKINDKSSRHYLDLKTFESLITNIVERTISICRGVIIDAGISVKEIKGVVLVGGCTRVPLIRRRVSEFFECNPLVDINPDEVVAVGAAMQAYALTAGSSTLLLDVTPLSLGIETMGGIVERVIPRNTPIPVAMAQEFTTYQNNQDSMLIHVVQGEREMVEQCRSLASFVLSGIPQMVAGRARICVTFVVDADGLLTVSAKEKITGIEQEVSVKPSYGLTEDEMTRMLRDSLEHAREDIKVRLFAEAKVEAIRSLLAVRAALVADGDLLSIDEKSQIHNALESVESAIRDGVIEILQTTVATLEDKTKIFAIRRINRGIHKRFD